MERLNSLKEVLGLKKYLNKDKINHSKQRIEKLQKRSCEYQSNWKYTYTLEEILN